MRLVCDALSGGRATEPSPTQRATPAKLERLRNSHGPASRIVGRRRPMPKSRLFVDQSPSDTRSHLFLLSELTILVTALPCVITRGYARPRMLGIDRRRAGSRTKFSARWAELTPLVTASGKRGRGSDRFVLFSGRIPPKCEMFTQFPSEIRTGF